MNSVFQIISRRVFLFSLTALLLAVWSADSFAAQQPTAPNVTGLIAGRVIDSVTNEPVRGTIVAITGSGIAPRRVIVDEQGRYVFTQLPAGAFTIVATKAGYVDGSYGKQRPNVSGRPVELISGQRVIDANLKLWPFASISGTIRDETGEPIADASVQALRRTVIGGHWRWANASARAYTDSRGVFRIASLTPGEYVIFVNSLVVALPATFAQEAEAAGRAGGKISSDFMMDALTRGASAAVDVINLNPAMRHIGDMLLETAGIFTGPTPADANLLSIYPTTWYPGVTSAEQATPITVSAGDSRLGMDFKLDLLPTTRISGTALGANGPVPHLGLRLIPSGLRDVAAESQFAAAITATDATGKFTFLGARPGLYTIRALTSPLPPRADVDTAIVLQTANGSTSAAFSNTSPSPGILNMVSKDPVLWAAEPVSVGDKDISGLSVAVRNGLRATGRVEFEGAAPKPTAGELMAMKVSIEPIDGRFVGPESSFRAQVDPNGNFYTIGLIGGSYFVRVQAPPKNWTLKSVQAGALNVSDRPLVLNTKDVDGLILTFTDHTSTLSGMVRDGDGKPDAAAAILLFPADETEWTDTGVNPPRLRSARPTSAGSFTIDALPPGEYHVIAVNDEVADHWEDPAFLRILARSAAQVRITEGQPASADLKTMAVKR